MTTLSRVGEIVRRNDPDRFFTSLFAPAERRETLWTLYAFNHELARAREAVREPMMAMIRLQWWREVVEGARRHHEVATPLGAALDTGTLGQAELLAMIEGRELDPPEYGEDWSGVVAATAGAVAAAAGRALGAEDLGAIAAAGSAYGAAGCCAIGRSRARRRCRRWKLLGQRWLQAARSGPIPGRARAAALPAVLAARDFRRTTPVRARGAGDKLAVLFAATTGRL